MRQPARPLGERNETILIQKEQDDQTVLNPGWRPIEQANENDWVGMDIFLPSIFGFDFLIFPRSQCLFKTIIVKQTLRSWL